MEELSVKERIERAMNAIDWAEFVEYTMDMHAADIAEAVSYTHLPLPPILLV